jgi:hypothetical protein
LAKSFPGEFLPPPGGGAGGGGGSHLPSPSSCPPPPSSHSVPIHAYDKHRLPFYDKIAVLLALDALTKRQRGIGSSALIALFYLSSTLSGALFVPGKSDP